MDLADNFAEGSRKTLRGIFKTNGFEKNADNQCDANMMHLFLTGSRFNHDCTPNCRMNNNWSEGQGKVEVQTIRKIKPGTELTISYVNACAPAAQRKATLKD